MLAGICLHCLFMALQIFPYHSSVLSGTLKASIAGPPLWFEPGSGHVGKPNSSYKWSGGFFPGFSGFRPPLMKDRLDISEIFLKGQ